MPAQKTPSAAPATGAALVVLADADLLTKPCNSLYVGTGGNVRVTTIDGDDVVIPSVPAGTVLPIGVVRVWLTNTTASNIVALY